MAKSSSSRKKRPKHSSLERARKRSKTKRAKAKKLRRHEDSDSYSTDDSRSSASVSSSSEDSYRGRESRSRTLKDAKGSKRRGRSRSSSSEESLVLRKKKGSKRKLDSEVRKKPLKHKKKNKKTATKKKKKSRRDASISSRSCSTCESSSGSSDESEYESHRGRSKKRENSLKSSKNVKNRSRKRRYRSISCSSGGRDSGSDYWREAKVTDGSISKRLKSVITFTKDDMEEKELDEHKEEIIYEDDGYPSSRSNDSFDGGSKRISSHQSPVASEKKRSTENEKKEEPFDIKTTELSGRCLDGDDQSLEEKPASDGFGTTDSFEEKIDEIAKTDDLETILRQKALENLKRFRGINARNNPNRKDESCGASDSPCPRKAGLSQRDPKDGCPQGVKGDSVDYLQEEKSLDVKNGGSGSASVENNACLTNKSTIFSRGLNKQRLVTTALKQALSNCTSSAVEAPKVKLVNERDVTCVGGKTNSDKVSNSAVKSSAGVDAGLNRLQDEDEERLQVGDSDTLNNACGSQDINSSKGRVDDGKESSGSGSQLERKTMSVMRGGEMVQVSYKVYIPKKAPALARRQLNR